MLVNWYLFSNGKKVIEEKNIECECVENKYIKYKENNDTYNLIDFVNDTYVRENKEFTFKIDFKNKCFEYLLKENNMFLNDIVDCKLEKNDKTIKLSYKIDNESKSIMIQIL